MVARNGSAIFIICLKVFICFYYDGFEISRKLEMKIYVKEMLNYIYLLGKTVGRSIND